VDNTKIVERIRKLLAMSEDQSSPEEAAIAAGRAAKLLQKYNLDRADIIIHQQDSVAMGTANTQTAYRNIPSWVSTLGVPVAELHDCNGIYTRIKVNQRYQKAIKYQGLEEDALVASYVFDYLIEEINRLAKAHKKRAPQASRADLHAFRLGASEAICDMLNRMIREKAELEREYSNGTALVVAKKSLVEAKFGVQRTSHRKHTYSGSGYGHGYAAGAKVSIRSGLTGGVNATCKAIT
jgi:hypothetical protein